MTRDCLSAGLLYCWAAFSSRGAPAVDGAVVSPFPSLLEAVGPRGPGSGSSSRRSSASSSSFHGEDADYFCCCAFFSGGGYLGREAAEGGGGDSQGS